LIPLFESVPNFAEGRDPAVVGRISAAAAAGGLHLLDSSSDHDHHRLVLSLAGSQPVSGLFAAIAEAVSAIDLRSHLGVHPRRGAADVVPIVPLGSTSVASCLAVAQDLGEQVWSRLRVPVYFYGLAGAHTLAAIRSPSPPPFDLGSSLHPSAGAVSIGVRRPLVAYNLVLDGVSLPAAREVASSLRESSGGVPGIQALVFEVAAGVQLSLNLTRLDETPPARARAEAERRLPAGGSVASEEVVGLCPVGAAAGCPAADGRLLEARLAAGASGAAALLCRSLAAGSARSEEMAGLARRLAEEAAALSRLGFGDALAGAERAEAVRRVLAAGGVAEAELDGMLSVAARGFRAALTAEEVGRFPERVAALDRWLAEAP